jgi:hypothetical protein
MKRISVAAIAASLLIVPSALGAGTDGTYRGRTSQRFHAFVVVKGGVAQKVNVPWRARRCSPRDGYVIAFPRFTYTNVPEDPIEHSGNRFSDGGHGVIGKRGRRAAVTSRLTGKFVGANRIVGTEVIGVHTNDKFGRHKCHVTVHWSAQLVPPRQRP